MLSITHTRSQPPHPPNPKTKPTQPINHQAPLRHRQPLRALPADAPQRTGAVRRRGGRREASLRPVRADRALPGLLARQQRWARGQLLGGWLLGWVGVGYVCDARAETKRKGPPPDDPIATRKQTAGRQVTFSLSMTSWRAPPAAWRPLTAPSTVRLLLAGMHGLACASFSRAAAAAAAAAAAPREPCIFALKCTRQDPPTQTPPTTHHHPSARDQQAPPSTRPATRTTSSASASRRPSRIPRAPAPLTSGRWSGRWMIWGTRGWM